jgi:antitoxin (DNA-binding transcriptional repressor) of toxin-antitoxin stability system
MTMMRPYTFSTTCSIVTDCGLRHARNGERSSATVRRHERRHRPPEPLVPGAAQVDLARLPDDVAALIEALRPGEELVITADGAPVATISSMGGVLEGEIVVPNRADEDTEQPRTGYDAVTVVTTR